MKLLINNDNINTIKITKIKDWKIYFDFDGKHYMIHEKDIEGHGDPYDYVTTLYERILDYNGKVSLKIIDYCDSCLYLDDFGFNNTKITYSLINKNDFVNGLLKYRFAING